MGRLNLILAAVASFGVAMLALPGMASAQCCAPPPPPPPCCAAPPPCCTPPSPPPPSPPCCTPGHNVNVPGVNVFVGAAVVVNANVNVRAQAGAQAGGTVFFGGGGGGGGGWSPAPASLVGLNVEGRERMQRTGYQATRTTMKRVVIQAFCFDDREVPHPASQVTPDRDIDDAFDGELYRCLAGTHMQVTIAEYSGQINFSNGQTVICRKGESLWHIPGSAGGGNGGGNGSGANGGQGGGNGANASSQGGRLECRPQRPARDCNERSLLRRFGAGVKILTIMITETYTAYREETVRESSSVTQISLDGGVGGISY